MELFELLSSANLELFKAKAILNATVKLFAEQIRSIINDRYNGKIIDHDGMKYQFGGASSYLYMHEDDIFNESKTISIQMAFFCISKLPKAKRERVEKAKREYDNSPRDYHRLRKCNFTPRLWFELYCQIPVKDVLSGDFSDNDVFNQKDIFDY